MWASQKHLLLLRKLGAQLGLAFPAGETRGSGASSLGSALTSERPDHSEGNRASQPSKELPLNSVV